MYITNYGENATSHNTDALRLREFQDWPEECQLWILVEEMAQDPPEWMYTTQVYCQLWYHHHQNGTQEAIAIYNQ